MARHDDGHSVGFAKIQIWPWVCGYIGPPIDDKLNEVGPGRVRSIRHHGLRSIAALSDHRAAMGSQSNISQTT